MELPDAPKSGSEHRFLLYFAEEATKGDFNMAGSQLHIIGVPSRLSFAANVAYKRKLGSLRVVAPRSRVSRPPRPFSKMHALGYSPRHLDASIQYSSAHSLRPRVPSPNSESLRTHLTRRLPTFKSPPHLHAIVMAPLSAPLR